MRRLRPLLGLVVSLGALAVVIWQVEPARLGEALATVEPAWVVALALTRVGVLVLQAWRWQALLAGLDIPGRTVLDGVALGAAGNNLLPARAGEFVRTAWVAQQTQRPASAILVTVGAERFLDLVTLAVLMAWTGLRFVNSTGLAVLAVAAAALAVALPVLRRALRDRLSPQRLAHAALRTVLLWGAVGFITAVGARTVGIHLDLHGTFFVAVASAVGGAVPSAPGNVGTFHLACAGALVWLGFPPGPAAAAAVVMHGVSYLVETAWGLAVGGAWLFHPTDMAHFSPDAARVTEEGP